MEVTKKERKKGEIQIDTFIRTVIVNPLLMLLMILKMMVSWWSRLNRKNTVFENLNQTSNNLVYSLTNETHTSSINQSIIIFIQLISEYQIINQKVNSNIMMIIYNIRMMLMLECIILCWLLWWWWG